MDHPGDYATLNSYQPRDATVLCFLGGLLLAVAARTPTVWLLVLAFYSASVAVRAELVLRRPIYAERLERQNIIVPSLYRRLECRHNTYWVPAVMFGWVRLHSGLAVVALAAASVFLVIGFGDLTDKMVGLMLWIRLFVGIGLLIGTSLLSKPSYETALHRYPPPAGGIA